MAKKVTDEDIGLKIRAARTRAKLRQEDLADKIGRTLQSVSNYERGFTPVTALQLYAIAEACGCSARSLLPLP